jgi:hemin uptake protein HemP
VKVFVNGEYTNFMVDPPKHVNSYELMTGDNSIIIEQLWLNGKKYLAKFQLENGEVIQYGAYEGKQLHEIDSFKIAPKQEVSYTKH